MPLDKLRTLIPLEQLEQEAQQQIYTALNLDFLKTLAIMPDCHTGYSLPIGGVALLDNVISPNYVGYDIGCGMCCVIIDVTADIIEKNKQQIYDDICKRIPVGFDLRDKPINGVSAFSSASGDKELNKRVEEKLEYQMGTLGGGKHDCLQTIY